MQTPDPAPIASTAPTASTASQGADVRARLSQLTQRVRHHVLFFPVVLLLGAGILVVNELAYRGASQQTVRLMLMAQARLDIFAVLRHLTDAETHQRAYLLTGHPTDKAHHLESRQDTELLLKKLDRELIALGDTQLPVRQQLLHATDQRISEMDELMRLYDRGERDSAIELVRSGIGHDYMQAARMAADEMIGNQNLQISKTLAGMLDWLQLSRVGIAAMTLGSLLVLALLMRQGRVVARFQLEQEQLLRAERDRLEVEVRRRTGELTALARYLVTVREDERARLARDLHDELGALLTAAKLDVARIRPALQKALPDQLTRLAHLTELLNHGIALKRRIIEDLRPSTLDKLGLQAALEVLCQEGAERLGIPVQLQHTPVPLSSSAELTVFRMVQEALTNVAKYAQAGSVSVSLGPDDDGHALLEVQDDGQGFDAAEVSAGSHGLMGMRYRLESEGGSLAVHSQPGAGTCLTARLPLCGPDSGAHTDAPDHGATGAPEQGGPAPATAP